MRQLRYWLYAGVAVAASPSSPSRRRARDRLRACASLPFRSALNAPYAYT
jgi:hypothetical protein